MQPLKFCLILTFIVYSIWYDTTVMKIFLGVSFGVCLFHLITPNKYNWLRRRLTIATWTEPSEGVCLARFECDMSKFDAYAEKVKTKYGLRVTPTHVCIKAIAEAIHAAPDCNGKVVLGKFFPYDTVDISCLVDIGGKDLASTTVESADGMTIEDIADYINSKAKEIKTDDGDKEHKQKISALKILPSYLIELILGITEFLSVDCGLTLKPLGLKRHSFGGAMVTSVGGLGVDAGYAPLTPFARTPLIVALGMVKKHAVVKDDKIVILPICGLNISLDHRFIDGSKAGKLAAICIKVMENPEDYSRLKKTK